MDIETKLDVLVRAALDLAENECDPIKHKVLKKAYTDYRNDILKELRRLYRCEKKLQEVAAL